MASGEPIQDLSYIQDSIRDSRNEVTQALYEYYDEELGHVFKEQLTRERYKGADDERFCKITTDLAKVMAKKFDQVGSSLQSEYQDLLFKIATLNKFEVKVIAENLKRSSFSDEELVILKDFKLYRFLTTDQSTSQVQPPPPQLLAHKIPILGPDGDQIMIRLDHNWEISEEELKLHIDFSQVLYKQYYKDQWTKLSPYFSFVKIKTVYQFNPDFIYSFDPPALKSGNVIKEKNV